MQTNIKIEDDTKKMKLKANKMKESGHVKRKVSTLLAQAALCAPPQVAFAMYSSPLLLPTLSLFSQLFLVNPVFILFI